MRRKQNFQTIAWFWDLRQRDRLDMDPPYQRRSVWNQAFKNYFIDTVLLEYPAPAIFLYEEITPEGIASYHVVDGKQRLLAIFEFVSGIFPVSDEAERSELRGKYFRDLDDAVKKAFWSVEYLPTSQDGMINNIFDRINRNTARLTAQELRHAQFGGEFITAAEDLSDWMLTQLPPSFPNITSRSRKQMKDVEFVAHVLLLLEAGPKGYSTTQLDEAFSQRDSDWAQREEVTERFRTVIARVAEIVKEPMHGPDLARSRLKNQADCYSLFGAVDVLMREGTLPDVATSAARIARFIERVEREGADSQASDVAKYYEAARSASNDTGPRDTRTNIMKRVLLDQIQA
jgi:hypothetical protein